MCMQITHIQNFYYAFKDTDYYLYLLFMTKVPLKAMYTSTLIFILKLPVNAEKDKILFNSNPFFNS